MTRTSSKSAGIRKIPSVASPLRAMICLIVKMVKMMRVAMVAIVRGDEEAIPGR